MSRLLPSTLTVLIVSTIGLAQADGRESVVSSSPSITLADEPPEPAKTTDIAVDPASLLPDLPPLSPAKATLIGGTIERVDRVQDKLTVRVFGGEKMKVVFDPRTRIYRDGSVGSVADLRQGDRVYVDTVLEDGTVFARNIRLKTGAPVGESQGIIASYSPDRSELTIRDLLSPHALKVRLSPSTRIVAGDRSVTSSQLVAGSLVAIKFGTERDGHNVAREVAVLAAPGASFTFAGKVTSLDLRSGLLVITSATNHKTYEIYVDPSLVPIDDSVRQGADVTVLTRFQDNRYVARSVTVNSR
jgi:Domain of unknown function (DUF5666)